jgi:hypothetical protein
MRELHHIGIPTKTKQPEETYLEGAKLFITNADASPNKIEWLRFEPGSPLPEMLQTSTHIAYRVDDLPAEMKGRKILMEPFSPLPGVKVAFVVEEGLPIELMATEG